MLMNTGIAAAQDPVLMAEAMKQAVMAGRNAFLAGRMPEETLRDRELTAGRRGAVGFPDSFVVTAKGEISSRLHSEAPGFFGVYRFAIR